MYMCSRRYQWGSKAEHRNTEIHQATGKKVIVDFQTKLFVYHSDHLNCDVIVKKHSSDVFNHF